MAKTVTHQDLKSYWGDEDHLEAAQNKSFAQMIFETLSEKTPSEEELKIFELILNLSIDHGPETPSAIPVVQAAKEGKTLSEALSLGLLQINESHGGAIEKAMENLYRVKSQESRVKELVESYLKVDKKLPGFGHRIYKDKDPRTQLIFNKLTELGFSDEFIKLEQDLGQELNNQSGKSLPINIDGAIAVALCTFGWESKLGNAVFIIARVPGLIGQYLNFAAI